ncbi:MAG: primosomal protein N' [Prochlorotrichaceae cyanobacterium]
MEPLWVEVLVDAPGRQPSPEGFTYAVPPHLRLEPGDIVQVPFGSQTLGAIVLAVSGQPPDLDPSKIRPVTDLVCRGFFPDGYWALLQRVASYYYTPIVSVVRTALPPGVLARSQRRIALNPESIPPNPELFLRSSALAILRVLQQSATGDYTWRYLQKQVKGAPAGLRDLTKRGWVRSYLESPTPPRPKLQQWVSFLGNRNFSELTAKQQQVVRVLQQAGGELPLQALCAQAQVTEIVVKNLAKYGDVILNDRQQYRTAKGQGLPADQVKTLNTDQAQALEAIVSAQKSCQIHQRGRTVLLHGVTGSGKTEVYLQAIQPCLAAGRSALVLVPEIGLTPQLTDRFEQRFGSKVLVYHSGLSDGERYDTWRLMLLSTPQVIIGTRSAIFAPLPKLGLIILDEEHDSSFKQDQPMPCYHARTVAQWRSQLTQCVLLLGSATPSVETWVDTASHRLLAEALPEVLPEAVPGESTKLEPLYLSLPQRIYNRPQPQIQVVDMRQELQRGNRSLFSHDLQTALREMKAKGQQGLLFVPRRGHSTFVSCRSCGEPLGCPHCDVSLTYHQTEQASPQHSAQSSLRCHYCNYSQLQPKVCPQCQSPYLKFFGSGTQRVTQELDHLFPELTWIRFDSDTTRRKDAHRTLLHRFGTGEADLLVGTQMLTKGIDLPQVTVVGILAADGLLHLPDFRAGERACQILLQVAGRSGRGADPGTVILQTYSPDHAVVNAVTQHRYGDFLDQELPQRSPLFYPPFSTLLLLRLTSPDPVAVEQVAQHLGDWLQTYLEETGHQDQIEVLGPAPAPILRIAQRYRWHLLLKVKPAAQGTFQLPWTDLQQHLAPHRNVALTIDVDPIHLS